MTTVAGRVRCVGCNELVARIVVAESGSADHPYVPTNYPCGHVAGLLFDFTNEADSNGEAWT